MKEITPEALDMIFNTATIETYNDLDIDKYEDLYKIEVFEYLADYLSENYDEETAEDMEESCLVQYNPHNLVNYFK